MGKRVGGFRRIVGRPDSCAAGGENQIGAAGIRNLAQLLANGRKIVRHAERRHNFPLQAAAKRHHRGTRSILAFTSRHGITDGEDCDAHMRNYCVSTASRLASSLNRIASISRPVVFFVVVLRMEALAALKSISTSPSLHKITL